MKPLLFAAVIAAQGTFLAGWAGWHEYVRQTAPVICLETEPVDPRDLLRGDYMILGYKISRPPAAMAAGLVPGDDVWAVLRARAGHYEIASVGAEKPAAPPDGGVAVRAHYTGEGRLRYGIEEFFVPEDKGTPSFTKLEVEASVGPDHRLQIKRVLLDGREYP